MSPIRVLVVDDSAVARQLTSQTLAVDPAIEVVGTAATAHLALVKAALLRPEVVTLDGMLRDGDALQVLRTLKSEHPEVVVLVVTEPTPQGAALALAAMDAGADDHVTAPESAAGVVAAQRMLLTQLAPRIRALGRARRRRPPRVELPAAAAAVATGRGRRSATDDLPVGPELARVLQDAGVRLRPEPPAPPPRPRRQSYSVLALGASTGGPEALALVFRSFHDLRLPVVVVQHMPPNFTALLARRLDGLCPLSVSEATDGDEVLPGRALVAPGDRHLELRREKARLVVRLTAGPRENFVRPAVDVLFRTAADACGAGVLAAVLTGMGRDGVAGARAVREAGGTVLVQDEATSVVWGMPGAVAEAGLADEVVSLSGIGPALLDRAQRRS